MKIWHRWLTAPTNINSLWSWLTLHAKWYGLVCKLPSMKTEKTVFLISILMAKKYMLYFCHFITWVWLQWQFIYLTSPGWQQRLVCDRKRKTGSIAVERVSNCMCLYRDSSHTIFFCSFCHCSLISFLSLSSSFLRVRRGCKRIQGQFQKGIFWISLFLKAGPDKEY